MSTGQTSMATLFANEMSSQEAELNNANFSTPPFDDENAQPANNTTLHPVSPNNALQCPSEPPIQSDLVLSTTSVPPNQTKNASKCFDEILEVMKADEHNFIPFLSINEEIDWFIDTNTDHRLIDEVHAGFLETLDKFLDSKESPHRQTELEPERNQSAPYQSSEAIPKREGYKASGGPMKPPEQALNETFQHLNSEDQETLGALPAPITDHHPCFKSSAIEIDHYFCDLSRDSRERNLVRVGEFLELEELPTLKEEHLPNAAPGNDFQTPFSSTSWPPRNSDEYISQKQEHKQSEKEGIPVRADLPAASSVIQQAGNNCNISKKTSRAASDRLNFRSGSFPVPRMMALPPAPNSMKNHTLDPYRNPLLPFSRNEENLLEPHENPLLLNEASNNRAAKLYSSSLPPPEDAPHQACSPSDASEILSNPLQVLGNHPKTPLRHGSINGAAGRIDMEVQSNLMRRTSHASSNHQQSMMEGKSNSPHIPVSISSSTQNTLQMNPNHLTNGEHLETPTSILCQEIPFQFHEKSQSFSAHPAGLTCIPFDNYQSRGNANIGGKRRCPEVGFSNQAPAKKPRTTPFNPPAHQRNGQPVVSSHTSRIAEALQSPYSSSNLSIHVPMISSCNTLETTHAQTHMFTSTSQAPPKMVSSPSTAIQGVLDTLGGTQSQVTVSSPSKPRSTDVREERAQFPKRFICTECPEAFAFKENCDRHFKVVHQGRTVYFCHHCQASYLQSKTMRLHVEKHHHKVDGENSVFPCYWCEFKTNTDSDWSRHVSEMHPGYKNKFRGSSV